MYIDKRVVIAALTCICSGQALAGDAGFDLIPFPSLPPSVLCRVFTDNAQLENVGSSAPKSTRSDPYMPQVISSILSERISKQSAELAQANAAFHQLVLMPPPETIAALARALESTARPLSVGERKLAFDAARKAVQADHQFFNPRWSQPVSERSIVQLFEEISARDKPYSHDLATILTLIQLRNRRLLKLSRTAIFAGERAVQLRERIVELETVHLHVKSIADNSPRNGFPKAGLTYASAVAELGQIEDAVRAKWGEMFPLKAYNELRDLAPRVIRARNEGGYDGYTARRAAYIIGLNIDRRKPGPHYDPADLAGHAEYIQAIENNPFYTGTDHHAMLLLNKFEQSAGVAKAPVHVLRAYALRKLIGVYHFVTEVSAHGNRPADWDQLYRFPDLAKTAAIDVTDTAP